MIRYIKLRYITSVLAALTRFSACWAHCSPRLYYMNVVAFQLRHRSVPTYTVKHDADSSCPLHTDADATRSCPRVGSGWPNPLVGSTCRLGRVGSWGLSWQVAKTKTLFVIYLVLVELLPEYVFFYLLLHYSVVILHCIDLWLTVLFLITIKFFFFIFIFHFTRIIKYSVIAAVIKGFARR